MSQDNPFAAPAYRGDADLAKWWGRLCRADARYYGSQTFLRCLGNALTEPSWWALFCLLTFPVQRKLMSLAILTLVSIEINRVYRSHAHATPKN